jgi:DNA processing protein
VRFTTRSGGLFATDLDYRIVERGVGEYPPMLEHLPDPPERLWVAGRDLAGLPPCVAIVGTRTPNHYGEEVTLGLSADLARSGLCVVSGLARGIDSFAHAGALEEGTTVGVLPGGVDRCYPSSNRELYERIADDGVLVSEVPPGAPTHKHRFTHRNRIIAALSLAVVVVQAAKRSGALATARHGLDLGRDVFAVPGDIRVEVSAGVNELLGDGAAPCTSAGVVIERIRPELERIAQQRGLDGVPGSMPEEQGRILELLGGEVMSLSGLLGATGFSTRELGVALSTLEVGGWIARGPGALVRRIR